MPANEAPRPAAPFRLTLPVILLAGALGITCLAPTDTALAQTADSPVDTCSSAIPPTPIPASKSVIHLPADQYLHRGPEYPQGGAPTEWWWHVGTLEAGERTFGFEINAASLQALVGGKIYAYGLTQIMLTDVSNQRHFQATKVYPAAPFGPFNPDTWAQTDTAKPWSVEIKDPASTAPQASYVTMHAPSPEDPTQNMAIKALLVDETTKKVVRFDLTLSQKGPPFSVWGTGVKKILDSGPPLARNNYYYSLTHLQASGSISVASESFDVTGVTWMDHEYGYFGGGRPVKWILQDMQLDNGVSISNYTTGQEPIAGRKIASCATVQKPDGTTYFVASFVTPSKPWKSEVSNQTYFMKLLVEIPAFGAEIVVSSLMPSQEFPGPKDPAGKYAMAIYEGVASAAGTFDGHEVTGTAWSEQTLPEDGADVSRGHLRPPTGDAG